MWIIGNRIVNVVLIGSTLAASQRGTTEGVPISELRNTDSSLQAKAMADAVAEGLSDAFKAEREGTVSPQAKSNLDAASAAIAGILLTRYWRLLCA